MIINRFRKWYPMIEILKYLKRGQRDTWIILKELHN